MPLKEAIDYVESKSGYGIASMMSLNCVACCCTMWCRGE